MTDIDITRIIRHRLLAELNKIIAELLLKEEYGSIDKLLEIQRSYEKLIN